MKNIERYIAIGLVILLFSLLLRECKINDDKDKLITALRDEANLVTDSIKSDKPFELPEPLPITNKPNQYIEYPKDTSSNNLPYKEIEIIKDTIRLYNNELDKFDIHSDFLLQYPEAPKLISFELSKDYLELSLLEKSGSIIGKGYTLDLQNRKYLYSENQLTSEILKSSDKLFSKPTLCFMVNYQYRPLPSFHDLNLDFNIETKKFIYTLGINGYIYPNNKGITPKVSITYKIPF